MSKLWAFHRRNLAIRMETNRKYADVVAFFFKAYRNSTFNKCLGLDDDVFAYLVITCVRMASYISLRKHPFLLALRRRGRFAQNVPGGEERGETDVFPGYSYMRSFLTASSSVPS